MSDNGFELEYKRLAAEDSFYEFFKQAWPHMEGDVQYLDNWHIEAICNHLEAAFYRKIKNLIINVPPRSSKTDIVSIAFPAWVWIHNPEEKFMYASYASTLSLEHSLKCRRLIESNWYINNWSHKFSMMKDQNAKGSFANTAGGCRIATSVGGSNTGKGANILICDDPNSAAGGSSEAIRLSTNEWWSQAWYNRLNNPQEDIRIVIQQRLHENDITGLILNGSNKEDWVHLVLPMEYENSIQSKTIILPKTQGKVWQDPRTNEGELLWPERFSLTEVKNYRRNLGSYGYAGQYQQRPSPQTGGIINPDYFKHWKQKVFPDIEMRIQSWDTALTVKDTSSYSACTTWGVFRDQNNIKNIILLGLWRGKLEYPELRRQAQRLYYDYTDTGTDKKERRKEREIDVCLVEAKASGSPLIQDLRKAGIVATPFIPNPKRHGDKIERVRLIMPLVESGIIWMPSYPPLFNDLYSYAQDFIEQMRVFPKADSRDIVDTMTQMLIWLKAGSYIQNPKDQFPEDEKIKRERIY